MMESILRHSALRRNFWITIVLFLLVILLLRFFIGNPIAPGSLYETAASVLEALFATILTTAFVGAFIFYLTPKTADPTQLEILPPREITPAFDAALSNADFWRFKGGFGRYLRTKTIPTLSDRARRRNRSISIIAQIIDPRDRNLCRLHAELRNSTTTVDNRANWDLASVQAQLYATILTIISYQKQAGLLEIDLYLTNHFLPSRIDLSSEVAIVTREDRRAPAIQVRRGNYFYDTLDHEIAVTKRQSFHVQTTRASDPGGTLTEELAEQVLRDVDLWDEDVRPALSEICQLVNERYNPYA